MRGCTRKLGIFIGVLAVLVAVSALVFWLNWERERQLTEQARDAYNSGNAEEALSHYQKLMDRHSLDERTTQEARDRVDDLAAYLNAASLHENGETVEAIAAYETYLLEHFTWLTTHLYRSLAREALAILKPELAHQFHENGDYSEAIDVYLSSLAMEVLGSTECTPVGSRGMQVAACQEADNAIQQGYALAYAAIPTALFDWAEAEGQQRNYKEFADHCESIPLDYPEMLSALSVVCEPYELSAGLATWMKENPAIPVVEFSEELSRDYEDVWVLAAVFKEIGGKVGYELSGSGWIIDADGDRYGKWGLSSVGRGSVTVPAGGEAESIYRLTGDIFVDGYAVFTWEGEDEGGHPITIEERVHLLP